MPPRASKPSEHVQTPRDPPDHPTSRGVCLILKITATVHTPTGNVEAVSYTSAGTSFSQFAVIMTGSSAYAVTRIWDGRGGASHCYDPAVL